MPALAGWPNIIIQAAFGSDPIGAHSWTTISSAGQSFNIDRGRSFELDAVNAGVAQIVLNNPTRAFDPYYTGSPYYPNVTANCPVRIRASYGGDTWTIYDGFADSWTQESPDVSNNWAITTLQATDAFKFLAKNNLSPVHPWIVDDPVYGLVDSAIVGGQLIFANDNELPGDRINTILDLWPFPNSLRDIDDGNTQLGRDGTPLTGGALEDGETALSYCMKINDSEDGRFFVSANGKITFWARDHWQHTDSQHFSQLTLSDNAFGDDSYADIVMDPADDRYVKNLIERQRRDWDSPIAAADQTSIEQYGTIPDTKTILSRYPADVLRQVAWILDKYKQSSQRISQITIKPRHNPDVLFPAVLGLEIGDRITVKRKLAKFGSSEVNDYWIEAISHRVTAQLEWETVWQLAPVDHDVWATEAMFPFVEMGSAYPASGGEDLDSLFPVRMPGAPPGQLVS